MQEYLKATDIRTIIASSASDGYIFDQWSGDIDYITDNFSSITVVMMPALPVTVTAGYAIMPINGLRLTFDDITNPLNIPVADVNSLNEWNTFFDLPNNGTTFSSVTIIGNVVTLFRSASWADIYVKDNLFDTEYGIHLIGVEDNYGVISDIGVNSFGDEVNFNCTNLSIVNFPNVQYINDGAFYGCTSLANWSAPELISCGNNSFYGCSSLTSFTANNMTDAGNGCFAYCTAVTSFTLPMIQYAGDNCFNTTPLVSTFSFPSLLTAGNYCFDTWYGALLRTVDLPLCTAIGDSCFQGLVNITTIYLPSCTSFGTTVGLDYLFAHLSYDERANAYPNLGNTIGVHDITITIPTALMTCNGGIPDGDLGYMDRFCNEWQVPYDYSNTPLVAQHLFIVEV